GHNGRTKHVRSCPRPPNTTGATPVSTAGRCRWQLPLDERHEHLEYQRHSQFIQHPRHRDHEDRTQAKSVGTDGLRKGQRPSPV
ncbi:hypothetical protein BGX34_001612, partial [Mortierella sp. NVP85]